MIKHIQKDRNSEKRKIPEKAVLIWLVFFSSLSVNAQNLLDNEVILKKISYGLNSMYNYEFTEARKSILEVSQEYPTHPVVPFMEALVLYWEKFPLIPEDPEAAEFVRLMEEAISKAMKRLENNNNDLEGVFFDLFGRAFYVMFWADNGKPGKVFPHLNTMNRHLHSGMKMMNDFNEFYFTTGLYNYYIEAYPEKHPSYKPIAMLFPKGDKKLGMYQLKYCAENALFLRVEAKFFISLLYLNYENDLNTASEYASQLYREYPDNPFYTGKYLEILLFNEKYFFAPLLLERLQKMKDPFADMQYHLFRAMYLEKSEKRFSQAKKEYKKAIRLSEKYKHFTQHYNAIAYMGLGRISKREGDNSQAGKYFRMAKSKSVYNYVIENKK